MERPPRLIVVLVVWMLTFTVNAGQLCEKPISIAYGPYVSLLMVDQFLSPIHAQLEKATGCLVEYTLFDSFSELVESIVKKEHTIAAVPGSYVPSLARVGYQQVATLKSGVGSNYLVVHKKSSIYNVSDLSSKRVMLMSPFSESGAILIKALKDEDILDRVFLEYKSSYDSMLMGVVRKKGDAAMVVSEYWRLLSERVRASNLRVILQVPSNSIDYLIIPGNDALKIMFRKLLKVNESLVWVDPIDPPYKMPIIEGFIDDVIEGQRVLD